MPYIDKDRRFELDLTMQQINSIYELGENCKSAGELNYVITKIIKGYLRGNGLKYQYVNDILGALEGAKLEFYRRTVVNYEDKKIKENGDV